MNAPAIAVRRFLASDLPAIERLNRRLAAGGAPNVVYGESPAEAGDRQTLPRERLFVAAHGDEIRGAVYLREAPLAVDGVASTVGWVKYPVAESLVDRDYASVPAALILHLTRLQPRLLAVGLGGHAGPFAQLLARFRWTGDIVPTFILPLNVARVVTALPHLRRTRGRRAATGLLRWTGAAWLAGQLLPARTGRRARMLAGTATVAAEEAFSDWADAVWTEAHRAYPIGLVRDAAWLRWMYPVGSPGVRRLRVREGDRTVGWAVTQIADLREAGDASPYGPLVLGTLHDAFGPPEHAARIVGSAVGSLLDQGADIIVAQHTHPGWQQALRDAGFVAGPETFACYRSPPVESAIAAFGFGAWYVTRGDDGLFAL